MALGFYATLVAEAAEKSLTDGKKLKGGAIVGTTVNLQALAIKQIGAAAAREYHLQ